MTKTVTLNLTFDELKQIDKFVELNDETQTLFDKIKNAYPKPTTLFDVIRNLGYSYDCCYEIVDAVEEFEKSKEPEKEQQIKELVKESVKWCEENPEKSVEDYLKPHTPEQIEQSLKEAFKEVQQTEKWKETQRKIDAPPKFLKFELGQSLTDLIYDWCEDVFTKNSNDDMENCIGRLVYWIEEWLPKEQSANSQNAYVECVVEGFNDCLKKIKSKLRNKKDT